MGWRVGRDEGNNMIAFVTYLSTKHSKLMESFKERFEGKLFSHYSFKNILELKIYIFTKLKSMHCGYK